MTFEPGPANPQPFTAGMSLVPSFDVIELLPPGAADRLRALRQRVADLHALTVPFDDIREASAARMGAEQRLRRLTDHPHDSGFGLRDDDPRVLEQRRLVDKLTDDFKRLNERKEARSQAWREAGYPLQAIESWLRNGIPPGVVLEDHEVEVPKLAKGENGLLDAIENRRRRVRELRADQHRIRSAPYPSSHAKAQMRAQVEALAMQGAPSVSDLIEHDRKIVWPTQRVQSQVYNTGTPAIAFAEVPDIALVAWLQKEALIKRLDAEIDTESDDAAALSHEARQQQEAELMGDLLAIERDEAALIWSAMAQGLPAEHRNDCAPQAILQCRLVTAPRANPSPGTSPQHVITFGGRR